MNDSEKLKIALEALSFYADVKTYLGMDIISHDIRASVFLSDLKSVDGGHVDGLCPGKRAREALEKINSDAKLSEQHSLRGTGITTSQLKSLTDGGVYIVHSAALMEYIKDLCDEHCQRKIHIVTVDQVLNHPEMLVGLNCKIEVDHSVHENLSWDKLEELHFILEKYRAHK